MCTIDALALLVELPFASPEDHHAQPRFHVKSIDSSPLKNIATTRHVAPLDAFPALVDVPLPQNCRIAHLDNSVKPFFTGCLGSPLGKVQLSLSFPSRRHHHRHAKHHGLTPFFRLLYGALQRTHLEIVKSSTFRIASISSIYFPSRCARSNSNELDNFAWPSCHPSVGGACQYSSLFHTRCLHASDHSPRKQCTGCCVFE